MGVSVYESLRVAPVTVTKRLSRLRHTLPLNVSRHDQFPRRSSRNSLRPPHISLVTARSRWYPGPLTMP